jgi:predicted RNA-binding Zn-ribbon protein involved in translation (DUF1610 family)
MVDDDEFDGLGAEVCPECGEAMMLTSRSGAPQHLCPECGLTLLAA